MLKHITIARPAQASGPAIYVEAATTLTLNNSILTNYNPGIYLAGTLNEDYNLFYNNDGDIAVAVGYTYNPGGHSTGGLNPLLANPAGGDYHLRSNSPAIGTGTNLGVTIDLDGLPRLGRWDKGAYQFSRRVYLPVTRK